METSHLWLYTLLVFGIIVIPGIDMAYVIASSLKGGLRAGFTAVFGIVCGGIMHVLLSVIGISLLVKTSPQLYNILLISGALYIMYIGYSLIKGASPMLEIAEGKSMPLWKTFTQAAITPLLNPKAYLFMIAVFPQYLRPEQGKMVMQFIVLGMIIAAMQILIYGAYAMLANKLRLWLMQNQEAQIRIVQAIGVMLIATAIYTLSQLKI